MYTDFLPCGDLMGIISKFDKLNVEHAKFYGAQIVSCLSYLHHQNYIYRDLKPENVLI